MGVVGSVLKNRYEIIAELGKGGMSTVYFSRDKNLGSYWAVKQVKNNNSIDMDAFKREVELLSSLNHSDVPRIVDKIEMGDDFFVVMDFISGISLGKKVAAEGPQREEDVINWAKMLCDVLYYLHNVKKNPIVYRDMKPDNIMLTELGRVKLIDFGIAKECIRGQAQTGAKVGTKGYAAPEQYKGEALDERTDIYSLGVTLYYLVTAKVPGDPPYAIQPIRQINPKLSEGLEFIINKCTQPDASQRYQNCMELKYDLENIEKLNSKYRKAMRNKLFRFSASVLCFIISLSLVFIGHNGIEAKTNQDYDSIYSKAQSEIDKDKNSAINDFQNAIKIDPSRVEAYEQLYKLLLPDNEDKVKTEQAIDLMKNYVDNPKSAVDKNPELSYELVKSCIEVQDPTYAGFASTLIQNIKNSSEYKNNQFSTDEIESYEVIADWYSKDINKQDFKKLNAALINLENDTTSKALTADNKLNNYYNLIKIYSNYPDNLTDAYSKIVEIGTLSKKIIDTNRKIKFTFIQPMYESIAESLYDSGISSTDLNTKRSMLSQAITWYGYLKDNNLDLAETAEITKGDVYRTLFETYSSVDERKNINSAIIDNLNKAAAVYQDVLSRNPNSFLAEVNLSETYLDMLSVKSDISIKENAQNTYNKVLALKKASNNLDVYTLSQFSSLKQQMQNYGLGGDDN